MLDHKGTVRIDTERLILRCFNEDDADNMYDNWIGDSDTCKYMRWAHAKNIEETRAIIMRLKNSYKKPYFYQWAIIMKETNENIGEISLSIVDEIDLCGGTGYCISKKHWGQGLGTESLKAVLNFAFNSIGFNRIEAYHSISNPASGRVMQKLGMIFEGFAKQKYKSNRGFEDCNMYSILKEDFNECFL